MLSQFVISFLNCNRNKRLKYGPPAAFIILSDSTAQPFYGVEGFNIFELQLY